MSITTFPLNAVKALATLTRPAQGIFLLSMHNLPDNRLTPIYIKDTLIPALDFIELEFRRNLAKGQGEAALVITGEREKNKFFSNGLQLELVVECDHFFRDYYYKLMSKLITMPMMTISAINGHCFAGGFCLSQSTDFRFIRAERAWCCMNEVDFGAPLPVGMAAVLNGKLSTAVVKKVMLNGHRFTAPEALAAGMVDEIVPGDGEAVIARAIEFAESQKKYSATGVLGMMKQTLYAEILEGLKTDEGMRTASDINDARLKELEVQAKL